jgi:dipeptidyl aminopeptidase/acylaminoacyl peptidase
VSAAGGVTTALTVPDTTHGERDHIWPIATPDGAAIVFVVWRGALQSSELAITSSAGGKATPLGIPGIRPLAVLDGRLVYVQADGAVMAVPLDVAGRKVRGAPVPVHDRVTVVPNYNGNSGVFVSRGGAMVTSRGGSLAKLAWLMPGGRVQPILPEARPLYYARLSPDERHIAVVVGDGQKRDVWIYDVELGTFSRLTNMGTITSVEWTADGSRLVYAASEKQPGVWSQAPTGGTQPQKIYESPSPAVMAAVAPDQRSLLLNAIPGNYWEVERVVLDSGKTHQTFVATVGAVGAPQFAPGGRWVALASTESEGSSEIYVRSYPDPSSRIQISVGGGFEPVWSPDGRRLFYRSGQRLMAARVALEPEFRLLGRDTVTTGMPGPGSFFSGSYDVARDGKRILAIVPDRDEFQLVVSPFWITELRRRLAEAGGGAAAKP